MQSFLLMLTFLTRIPIKIKGDFKPESFGKGAIYMPVIGLIIGLPLWAFYNTIKVPLFGLNAFMGILIYIGITGGLHLDGLADYSDGVYSARDKKRMLEIMADSSIGAFGVIGLILYFLGLFIGLLHSDALTLLLMPVVGRIMALLLCGILPYPKEQGMGKTLIDYSKPWMGLVYLLPLGLGFILLDLPLYWPLLITLIATFCIGVQTKSKLGGMTGDVIGATIEITQIVWLMSCVVGGVIE